MGPYIRQPQASRFLGESSKSYFWWLAKNDPDFPKLIKLGPKITVVSQPELEEYVRKKAQQTADSKQAAAEKAVAA